MAHTYTSAERSNSIFATIRSAVASWRETAERRRNFQRTYHELDSLSDRELADIGVSRSEVADIAWSAAQRV